jgi:hypothetical protein
LAEKSKMREQNRCFGSEIRLKTGNRKLRGERLEQPAEVGGGKGCSKEESEHFGSTRVLSARRIEMIRKAGAS